MKKLFEIRGNNVTTPAGRGSVTALCEMKKLFEIRGNKRDRSRWSRLCNGVMRNEEVIRDSRFQSRDLRERSALKGCHRLALAFKNVSNRSLNVTLIPQPSRAPVTGPPPSIAIVEPELIEAPARRRFQLGHDELRLLLSADDDMHVSGSDVDSRYLPVALNAAVDDRSQYGSTPWFVQGIRESTHQSQFGRKPARIWFHEGPAKLIVASVHGAFVCSVHVSTVTGEGDEVRRQCRF